jgi:hypothetical protein
MEPGQEVKILQSKDEALVFFEFLSRFNDAKHDECFQDQAEQRVRWDIQGILESNLVERFREDYLQLLAEARNRVRDKQ